MTKKTKLDIIFWTIKCSEYYKAFIVLRFEENEKNHKHFGSPVNIQFTIIGQVVIDYQRDLRHIQTTWPNICWNQNATKRNRSMV